MEKSEYYSIHRLEEEHWWYKALHELVLFYVGKYLPSSSAKLLDAGCGTGRLLQLLSGCCHVEGMDISPDAVGLAESRGLLTVWNEDLNTWKPQPNQYDLITSIDVLCCLENDEKVLQKFRDALKKGGFLIMNLAAFNFLKRRHDVIVHTKQRYTVRSIKKKLQSCGFTIERVTYRLPILFCVLCLIKLYEVVIEPQTIASDLKPLPSLLNRLLLAANRLENFFITRGITLPIGSSVFVVAKKI